jgi:hypothetical protein
VPNGGKIKSGKSSPRRRVWTIAAVRALGTVTDIEKAAEILGIGRTKAYELARANSFPVTVVRVGRRYLVPVAGLLRILDPVDVR